MKTNILTAAFICAGMVLPLGAALAAPDTGDVSRVPPAEKLQASEPLRVAPYTRTNRDDDLIAPVHTPFPVNG